ncbi:hypothetical protein HAX54_004293, partial [Datura stramonium]|nr:hypothetical protein [Datura stramonium]
DTALMPRYIGISWIRTGDSSLYRWLNICYPSFLLFTSILAAVHGYPPAVCGVLP